MSWFPISTLLYVEMWASASARRNAPVCGKRSTFRASSDDGTRRQASSCVEVAQHIVWAAVRDQAAAGHQQHPVGIDDRQVHIVGDEHDRAEAGHLQDGIHEVHVVLVVLPGRGFVHHQDARSHGQNGRDADALLLAERQGQRRIVLLVGQIHDLLAPLSPPSRSPLSDASGWSVQTPAPRAPSGQRAYGWDSGTHSPAWRRSGRRWPPWYRGRRPAHGPNVASAGRWHA